MTWLPWLGLALCLLAAAAVGLSAFGARHWADATQTLLSSLEAARGTGGHQGLLPPTRYDARELEGLPAPVQRYFRAALKDGQPIIAAATIDIAGTFNMSATGEQWKPFTSGQRVVTRRPGFLWDAKIAILPGLTVRVVDSYIAGNGLLHAAIGGLFTIADMRGGGALPAVNSCAGSLKWPGTRLRCCPARACDGKRSTTIRPMPPWWTGR